ncbi:MAG: accessory factor UbiK family protein [Gammaproteobacteria bacterium]|nr:accessory factor UbiK family protein [Gammaproteobacteria bacterium]
MIDLKSLDELSRKITAALPSSLTALQKDVENNVKMVLQSSLSKLDLVTREEFDVQSAVLAKTRAKLEQLEALVRDMETNNKQ